MPKDHGGGAVPPAPDPATARENRLAAALRDNLRRRKQVHVSAPSQDDLATAPASASDDAAPLPPQTRD